MFKKNLFNFLGIILGFCFLLFGIAVAKFGRPTNFLGFISGMDNNYYLSSEPTSSLNLRSNHSVKSSTKSIRQIKPSNVHSETKDKDMSINSKNVEQRLQDVSSNLDQLIDSADKIVNVTSTQNENTGEYIEKGKNKEQKNNLIEPESKNKLSSTTKETPKDLLTSKTTSNNISSSSERLSSRHQNILNQVQKIEGTTSPQGIESRYLSSRHQNVLGPAQKIGKTEGITSQKVQGTRIQRMEKIGVQEINKLNEKTYKINQNISETKNQINETLKKKKMMHEAVELLNTENNFPKSNIKGILNTNPIRNKIEKTKNNLSNRKEVNRNESKISRGKNLVEGNIQNVNRIIKQIKVSQPAPVVKKLENSAKVARNLAREAKKIVSTSKNLPDKQKKKIISMSTQIERKAQIVNSIAKEMKNKTTVNLAKDSDGDGISDFAEITIYHTNPDNPDTDGDGLNDGDEIKNGFSPLKSNNDSIIQSIKKESPKAIKVVKPHLLQVGHISNVIVKDPKTQQEKKKIVISGKSLPNIYLTVYVYSTPIVAVVKTDNNGLWQLTINNRLGNGSHEVYVALADSQGKLIARSNPTKFLVSSGLAVTEEDLRQAASIGGFPWANLVYYGLASLIILIGGLLIIMTTKKVQ